MKPKVYIETSVISYLTARPSKKLIVAAYQQITLDWWENRQFDFLLYVSPAVIQEASAGDEEAAKKRLGKMKHLPILELNEAIFTLAELLLTEKVIPENAKEDALHIATAAFHGMDYLLTWNYKHIANAEMRNKIVDVVQSQGYECSVICTPEELMGSDENVG